VWPLECHAKTEKASAYRRPYHKQPSYRQYNAQQAKTSSESLRCTTSYGYGSEFPTQKEKMSHPLKQPYFGFLCTGLHYELVVP
jgi:hypothetical protein